MDEFKKGDKVRVKKYQGIVSNMEGIIVSYHSSFCLVKFEGWNEGHSGDGTCGKSGWSVNKKGLELIEEVKEFNKIKSIMSNIINFAKNLTLSADEKLLREQGLKTECGDYTSDAQALAIRMLCEEKEVKMIEIAKAKKEEELNK